MAVNGVNSYNSPIRITGLGTSGLDIDSIVKQMMTIEKMPIDKLSQSRQLATWRQEAYREVTTTMQGFKSGFFDVLTPANNMLSQSTFKKYTTTALENGVASNVVSVTANSEATSGSHTIIVNKIATADVAQGTAVSKQLTNSAPITGLDLTAMSGHKINVTLDGLTKEITIGSYSNSDDLAAGLQSSISAAFGKTSAGFDKIAVTNSGDILTIKPNVTTVSRITLTQSGTDTGLSSLHFNNGDSNRISTGKTLAELSGMFSTPLTFAGGSTNVTSSANVTDLSLTDKSFSMTVDGVTQSYTFTSDPTSVDDLANTLNTWASNTFGAGKVNISTVDTGTGKKLSFDRGTSSYFTLNSGDASSDALSQMNITSGSMAAGELKFNINGTDFTFNASQSLSYLMSTINSDVTAKVTMTYDEASDKFNITSKQLGNGDNIKIAQNPGSGNFFDGASGITTANTVTKQGQDAEVTIDGTTDLVRSTNSITLNGITYNLLSEKPGVVQNINISADVNSVYDNIKKFVDKYNEVIDKLNSKISEDYDRDYPPLTDDQKSSMTSDDITKWETKAKTGLLRNDSLIQNALYSMRNALTDNVSGVNSSLSSIGITTGTYEEKGKLYIDETKLKAAIANDPDAVSNLFSKQSSISYTDSSQRGQRYAEEGLAQRLNDILQDNIRTTRDSSGYKGALLEKAGVVGDSSEFSNVLFNEITDETTRITDLTNKLADKESALYAKFTAMETALQKMQTQNAQLLSKLGS